MWEEELWEMEDVSLREILREGLDPRTMALRYKLGVVGLVGLYALPTVLFAVHVSALIALIYLMIFAISWDVVSGYTGQLSLGHAFFFALGGYSTSILNTQHGVDPLVSIPIAVLVAGLGGLVIGLPAIRLSGPYLSLVTLIVPIIMVQMVILWNESLVLSLAGLEIPIAPDGLGGLSGLDTSPAPLVSTELSAVVTIDSFQLSILANYYLALVALTVILFGLLAITWSSTGDVLTACREDETAVRAAGLNPVKFKLFAFLLSGIVGGLGGALFVHSPAGFPQPDAILNLQLSLDVIIVSILGGTGSLVGPIIGVLFFAAVDLVLGDLGITVPFTGVQVGDLQPLPILAITVFTIFYMPGGLLRRAITIGRDVQARVTGRDPADGAAADGGLTPLESIIGKYRDELEELRDRFR